MNKLLYTALFVLLVVVTLVVVNFVFDKILKRSNNIHLKFLKSLSTGIVVVILAYVYLAQFDITKDISKTLMQSGTLLVALVTFAAQQVLSNVISGIVISATKPFDVGDKITLLSSSTPVATGIVMDINTRHISIKMADGKVALIANSVVDSYVCINENTLDNNGYPLVMECSFDSDVNLAMELMQKELESHPLVLSTELLQSHTTCSRLTPNGFELKVIVFTENIADNMKACSDLRISIYKVWKENGIEIPYNTVTVQRG